MPEGSWAKAAYAALASGGDRRRRAAAVASTVVLMCAALAAFGRPAPAGASFTPSFRIPASARELIVVSSPTYDPPGYLASFRSYARDRPRSTLEAGVRDLAGRDGPRPPARRSGAKATAPRPSGSTPSARRSTATTPTRAACTRPITASSAATGGTRIRQLSRYNRFVHVPCGSTPPFARPGPRRSGPRPSVYAYFAVIDFNIDPTIGGADAPGSGIFLHAWEDGPTHGCVALPLPDLLDVLRWLEPADHPVIEIGTSAEVGHLPPGA